MIEIVNDCTIIDRSFDVSLCFCLLEMMQIGHVQTKLLIGNGAKLNAKDNDGETPFLWTSTRIKLMWPSC
eukprot:scaffold586_cov112-Skeletonema_dohrnii-CCMP3373.AAC.21